jgi:hypothetical protein
MDARRIAEALGKLRQHRGDDPLVDRRGRGVIQVNISLNHRHFLI